MVKIGMQICGTLENVAKVLTPQPEFMYFMKLQCTSCQEVSETWVAVSASDEVQGRTGRSIVSHLSVCKFCHKEKIMTVLQDTNSEYTKDDDERFKTIIVFDCRGVEPVDFDFRDGWTVVSVSGRKFTDIEIEDGEWVDFDEDLKESVALYSMKSQFVKV
ncbi:hypothetical protein PR048_032863 [Dryococelus australis]|uniref:Uncharacterized protein n=1 Tax=Dryococelus australis TaxID=614101 RepID=A0ABQ9G7L0_9NEOP|nr:hypothetical protein PR048_032863 [Dryococelus australis]